MDLQFKGKRKDNGEWITGYLVKSPDKSITYLIPHIEESSEYDCLSCWFCVPDDYIVDPLTVCPNIGKYDSEGKEVFIGDAVADLNDPRVGLGVIVWNEETASVLIAFDDGYAPVEYLPEVLVVGNIHDPEYSKIMPECLRKDPPAPAVPLKPLPTLKVIKGGKK